MSEQTSGIERRSAYFYNGQSFPTKQAAIRARSRETLQAVMSQQPGDQETLDFMIENADTLAAALRDISKSERPPTPRAPRGDGTPRRRGRRPRREVEASAVEE